VVNSTVMAINQTTLLYNQDQSFGISSINEPRMKFQYTIAITLNHDWGNVRDVLSSAGINARNPNIDERDFTFRAQSIELPSYSYDVQTLNQYNRKRVVMTSIQYNPITLQCHDTVDSKIENLVRAYNLYYFGNFEKRITTYQLDTTPNKSDVGGDEDSLPGEPGNPTATGYGYKPPKLNVDKYFIKRIKIIREFGDGRPYKQPMTNVNLIQEGHDKDKHAGTFRDDVSIINPMLTMVQHDTLSYSDSSPVLWSLNFTYEAIEYGNNWRTGTTGE